MIILDMEWNSGLYDAIRLDEIIQIGAVKVAGPGSPILDTFNRFIRPKIHQRLSPGAVALPDLALAQSSDLDFPTAMAEFWTWCGEDRTFASWGGNDLMVLAQNVRYWHLKYPLPKTYIDLQRAFAQVAGTAASPSLERVLEYCQVPDIFDPHNALYDAVYTWVVCQPLPQTVLEEAVREVSQGRKFTLPKRKEPWKGPFTSTGQMLGGRAFRLGTCPVCGGVSRVDRWYAISATLFYAPFTCPCGRQSYVRLEVRRHGGRAWGNAVTVPAEGRQREFFEERRPYAKVTRCAPLRRRVRRKRKKSQATP